MIKFWKDWLNSRAIYTCFAGSIVFLLIYAFIKALLYYNYEGKIFAFKDFLAVGITVFWAGLFIYKEAQGHVWQEINKKRFNNK